jgi:DNA invertase Pin-like site-specific DNA recombinase
VAKGRMAVIQELEREDSVALKLVSESGNRKPFRVGLYARVSTSTARGLQSPDMQLWEMREYCQSRGWDIVEEYVDRISGLKGSRPALNKLMQDSAQRKLDCVLTWKLDRFGRSLRHVVTAIEELHAAGVSFLSLKDCLDFSSPSGKLMFHVICSMSEFEASLTRERIITSLKHCRAKGVILGRPRKLVDVARINSLRASGHSWRQIAEQMGLSVGTVHAAARTQRHERICA